ncbi:hypothetical protein [Phreatobacter stygius]|uniref:Uncharacterized protein n=1 Tax=Phreatobacter stygius TaxID=1940610 RepID=A0A4D7BDA9_9HYPH|nr:hypothetical protein [Phreatobacter stygius]QCI68850.1 hypothetical protein E8M01_34240 [Phreatobacter stygius]
MYEIQEIKEALAYLKVRVAVSEAVLDAVIQIAGRVVIDPASRAAFAGAIFDELRFVPGGDIDPATRMASEALALQCHSAAKAWRDRVESLLTEVVCEGVQAASGGDRPN